MSIKAEKEAEKDSMEDKEEWAVVGGGGVKEDEKRWVVRIGSAIGN